MIGMNFIKEDMPKLKLISGFSDQEVQVLRDFHKVNEAIIRFENISREVIFKFLFGDKDGERLWRVFKLSCGSKICKFNTYLDSDQRDILLINLYYNEEMYSL